MINYIQALRGVAVLLVVVYHLTAITPEIKSIYYFEYGKIGVDIFFIISGYIMVLICGNKEPAVLFMKKRLIRIMPLYLVVTILAALINYRSELIDGIGDVWFSLVKSIALIPHYSIANQVKLFPIFIPGWTITYEMWFYLTIALVGIVFKRSLGILLVPFLLPLIYIFSLFFPDGVLKDFSGNSVYLCFSLGMLFRFYIEEKISVKLFFLAVASLFITVIIIEFDRSRFLIYGLPAFIVFFVTSKIWGARLTFLSYVGKVSFSLYLTHVFTINVVERMTRGVYEGLLYGPIAMMAFATMLSIAVAGITYIVFEKKVDMALRRKFL